MKKESLKESREKHFGSIPDKRVINRSCHKLVDIIAIAILNSARFITLQSSCQAGHHRLEKRRFWQVPAKEVFSPTKIAQWSGLQTLVIEQSSRTLWNKTTHSLRFFLSFLKPEFPDFPTSIRNHWGIENQLHWCLDVVFAEDDSRIRKNHAPRNMSLLRRLALNLLR